MVVNQIEEVGYRQTTTLLTASLARLGCDVYIADVDGVSFSSRHGAPLFIVGGINVSPDDQCDSKTVELIARSESVRQRLRLEKGDLIFIRTNPGRDLARIPVHETFLDFCRAAKLQGIEVINDPTNLRFFASKASLAAIDPKYCPPMIVSHNHQAVVDFVESAGCDCVIKPLTGSRGQDVIRIPSETSGLQELISKTIGSRGLVAQHFVESNQPGDKRVVVVNGEILEEANSIGGIERRPAADDFRANLHAGGTAHPLTLTDSERTTVEYAAKLLHDHGIWLAGVDLIADKIIEFNVFSTGGIFDAIQFSGFDFAGEIAKRLLASQSQKVSG